MTLLIKQANVGWPYSLICLGQCFLMLVVPIWLLIVPSHDQGGPVLIMNNKITLHWEALSDLMMPKLSKGKLGLDSVRLWGAHANTEGWNQLGSFLHLFLHPALWRIINWKCCLLWIASSFFTLDPKEIFKGFLSWRRLSYSNWLAGAMAESTEPREANFSMRNVHTPLMPSDSWQNSVRVWASRVPSRYRPKEGSCGSRMSQVPPRHTWQKSTRTPGWAMSEWHVLLPSCSLTLLCTQPRDRVSRCSSCFHFLTLTMLSLPYPNGITWIITETEAFEPKEVSDVGFRILASGWREEGRIRHLPSWAKEPQAVTTKHSQSSPVEDFQLANTLGGIIIWLFITNVTTPVLESLLCDQPSIGGLGTQSCPTLATPRTARFLCPWDSPGKNTGVGCHFLLQGIFLT